MHALLAVCAGLAVSVLPLRADEGAKKPEAPARADEDVKKKSELKWARGVADDFLKAAKNNEEAGMEALLSGEYAKLLTQRSSFGRQAPSGEIRIKTKDFDKATISEEDISPDQDEAVFKGVLESKSGTREFILRVVKGKEAGKWRVGFLMVEKEEKPRANTESKK